MGTPFDDTVFDFDLNFLNQPASVSNTEDPEERIDKLKKSIIFLKKKVLFSNSAVARYKEARQHATQLESNQVFSKEGCKQHLVEIKSFIDKVARLEDESRAAEIREKEKDETITDLQNKIVSLQTLRTQLQALLKEKNNTEITSIKTEKKKVKDSVIDTKKHIIEKQNDTVPKENSIIAKLENENETLRKENAKISILEKEIENLHKNSVVKSVEQNDNLHEEIIRIQKLEKEIEKLLKENARISILEKEIEILHIENARISILEKEIEILHKENARISILEKEIEILHKENARISILEKEIEILHKENARIPNLEKDIATLRKENANIEMLGKENEALRKENNKICNLQKEIETLRIKNAKLVNLERVNISLNERVTESSNKERNIENTHLHHKTAVKGDLLPKCDKPTQTYLSLANMTSDWRDYSEDENEDALVLPTSNDTMVVNDSISGKDAIVSRQSDIDNINEIFSVDTGRGSSLGCSDTEKCLRSPEYFPNDSPLAGYAIENKSNTKDVTMPMSPDPSLVLPEECAVSPTSPIIAFTDKNGVCQSKRRSTRKSSPIVVHTGSQINSLKQVSNSVNTSNNTTSNKVTLGVQDKEYSERHNSLQCEHEMDLELENIFRTMKLNYAAVTPIPRTPITTYETRSTTTNIEPKDQILKCMSLSEESDKLLLKLKGFVYRYIEQYFFKSKSSQPQSDYSVNQNNGLHKLIKCFETILKSKHILNEYSSSVNTNFNLEVPEPPLVHDTNTLVSAINFSPPEKDRHQNLHNNKVEKRLLQTSSPIHDNNKQLLDDCHVILPLSPSSPLNYTNMHDTNTLVPVSNSLPLEKDIEIVQVENVQTRLSQTSSPIIKDKNKHLFDDSLVLPLSPASPENYTNIMQEKQVDDGLLQNSSSIVIDGNSMQLSPAPSVPVESHIDKEISQITESVGCFSNDVEIQHSHMKGTKKIKNKKKSKLEKLKKTLEPKYKIKRENASEKSRIKPKHVSPPKKVSENDTSVTLNDKDVYEKAVKIMAEINLKQSAKIPKSPPKKSSALLSPKRTSCLEQDINSSGATTMSQNCSITTRSKRKLVQVNLSPSKTGTSISDKDIENFNSSDERPVKRRCRSSNEPLTQNKRVLRSSTVHSRQSTEDNVVSLKLNGECNKKATEFPSPKLVSVVPKHVNTARKLEFDQNDSDVITYVDLDIFSEETQLENNKSTPVTELNTSSFLTCHPKDSILCCMIEKYGVETVRPFAKKVPDYTVKQVCETIEKEIAKIGELPVSETKNAMNIFVADLRKLKFKHFITGLMKYLTKPERKQELFGKVSSPSVPSMTKAEQVLLYVISHLKTHWPSVDIVDAVLTNIEYTLFKLNRTPEFDVIESTSHFYALLCRYFKAKSRLRLFILDAMYCIQFKSVPLIKQCLEVWMHIIPLAHMGIAKSPLVTCLVYLLHFYKCDDKFNRVQEIRNILSRRYFYEITDWNETKILELFKNSIKDFKDVSIENKMLRLALIILAKRHGPRWCQNHIIKNLLQPMIEKEVVPDNVKEFCVSMIGPLMKPYPVDMKVHCEIAINQLTNILNSNPSPKMEEAAITSMMFINRHDQHGINKTLLTRRMKPMSSELEKIIRDYVKAKPLKVWKKNLTKIAR